MLSVYIIILGFFSGVSMETCPESRDIYPCECIKGYCKEIRVECNRDSLYRTRLKFFEEALKGLVGKDDVQLILYNMEGTLPQNIMSGIGITTLECWACQLDSLTDKDDPGLLSLKNHLQELAIYNSRFFPLKLHLGRLKSLRGLKLIGNDIPELKEDWLSDIPPPSLKELDLVRNNIRKIGSHVFSSLNSLVSLDLKDNKFGPIQRSMFPDNLAYLNLENNALTDLPIDLFSNMPHIQYISLNKNRITTLDEDTWSPIWEQLKEVSLKDNSIVCDDRLTWIKKSKKKPKVVGECSAPKELENTSLEDFIQKIKP